MDVETLSSKYLGALNSGFEAVETRDGLVAWMPAYYSDDDGVVLSVRSAPGGWIVTDDGSTLANLQAQGAAIDTPTFKTAWDRLARPAGAFVPNDSEDGAITGWATDETLGDVLNVVALASVRAEGLSFIRERDGGERFASKVSKRIAFLLSGDVFHQKGISKGGSVNLASGRSKAVTASIELDGSTLAIFQALGGRDAGTRERSFEHYFTIYSQATVDREKRFAVVDSIDEWDAPIVEEIREVGTVIPYRTQEEFDGEFQSITNRLLVPA